jgi:hypothetical protein
MNRFFFHSFPRPRQGESTQTQIKKGELIAASLLANGIILSPETYEIPLMDKEGKIVDRLRATQRRACFTELELEALPEHSETFGPFALVYEIDDLRQLGALPVFYIPLTSGNANLSGLASDLLGGVADAIAYVNVLAVMRNWLAGQETVSLTFRGREVKYNPEQSRVIRDLIDVLGDYVTADVQTTRLRLAVASSCFYPTENPKYTEPLHYYRQREWRLIAAFLTLNGQPVAERATPEQVKQLLEIDPDFYSKKLQFYETSNQVNALEEDSIGNRCYFFKQLGTIDVVGRAKAVIIPDESSGNSKLWDRYSGLGLRVIKQSQVPAIAQAGSL